MRMWEIRESHDKHRGNDYYDGYGRSGYGRSGMGHVSGDRELKDAYECGYEEGYEDAMRELEGKSTHGRTRRY